MKRNTIIAVAAAGAVIAGGSLAGAAMATGDDTAEVRNAASNGSRSALNIGGDDGADDRGRDDAADDAPQGDAQQDDGGQADAAPAGDGSAARQAVATALAEHAGVVTDVELERNRDRARGWEIDIYGTDGTWYRVRVTEDGTEVTDSRTGTDDDGRDDDGDDDDLAEARALAEDGTTDAATAIGLAEDETSATLREASFDDGAWELELRGDDGREHEVRVDAATGDVTARVDDDGDDDGRDDRDDNGDDADDRDDDGRDDDGDDDRDDQDDQDDRDDD
ncbi:PepSY domain-containing protein [Streptomyces avicenniae]|uniref:PepSY domain-containing protein n=1 Tax=Streptomyces avicenniae TaxID=500153 RepID=UPI00069BDEEC|nr:PepSY domain-containing protein [Streptomyces avicenniae]